MRFREQVQTLWGESKSKVSFRSLLSEIRKPHGIGRGKNVGSDRIEDTRGHGPPNLLSKAHMGSEKMKNWNGEHTGPAWVCPRPLSIYNGCLTCLVELGLNVKQSHDFIKTWVQGTSHLPARQSGLHIKIRCIFSLVPFPPLPPDLSFIS